MKNFFVIILTAIFVSVVMGSCKVQHERCAAYGKINKIDTGKPYTDKTEKPI